MNLFTIIMIRKDYINNFGHDRILFGSDFPFGDPKEELSKILNLSIAENQKTLILGLNLKRLVANSNMAERGRQ